MSTDTSTTKTITPTIRTYAADLEAVRTKKNIPTKKSPPAVLPVITENVTTKREPIENAVVPPFHTFSHKETPTLPKNSPAAVSNIAPTQVITIGADITAQDVARESGPAVIITDTKHKRFKLSTAVVTGLQDWWGNKKEAARKKKIPKYTVAEAQRRKGVIQKATSKTGRASSSDHSAVLARIKAAKQIPHAITPAEPPFVTGKSTPAWETAPETLPVQIAAVTTTAVRSPQSTPEPRVVRSIEPDVTRARASSWDSDIQTQVNTLVKEQNSSPSAITLTGREFTKIKKQRQSIQPLVPVVEPKILPVIPKNITPIQPSPIEVLPPKKVAATVPTIEETPQPQATSFITKNTSVTPTPITRPKILPTIPTTLPQLHEEIAPIITPEIIINQPNIFHIDTTDEASIRGPQNSVPERRFAPPREQRRSWVQTLTQTNHLVFIVSGALIFVVISGLSVRSYLANDTVVVGNDIPVTSTVFTTSSLTSTPVSAVSKEVVIQNILQASTETESLVEVTFLNPADGTKLSAANLFTLLDTSILFDFEASITTVALGNYRTAPWMVFNVTDKTTAFGGMLAWEKTIGTDLRPLFADGVGGFFDTQVGTMDVRILKNTAGEIVLTYGFINTTTLLITTDTTAFLNLASKLKT